MADSVDIRQFVTALQSRGRYTFRDVEARESVAASPRGAAEALRRLRRAGHIATPRRGFNVIVPPEYREAGCPPASWFIDDLMRFVGRPYYVGLLSAAAVHGAAHQQPMRFQVVTDRPMRPAEAGRIRVEFHVSRDVRVTPVDRLQTDTGYMKVSTPEATAFDLVRFAGASGGWANVAGLLTELAERLDADAFRKLAVARPTFEVQRLGHLLDAIGHPRLADPLARALGGRRVRTTLLAPGVPAGGEQPSLPWKVVANERLDLET